MKSTTPVRIIIEKWLWWATYAAARENGNGPLSAYKRAQKATAKLYA